MNPSATSESITPAVAAPAKKAARAPTAKTSKPVKTAASKKTAVATPPTKAIKAVKQPKPVKAVKAPKVEKAKKPKLVRDSFTIPKAEYELLDVLKARSIRLKQPAKKSELLRSGIKLLVGLTDAAFLTALQATPSLKTGRPKSDET